MGKYELMTEQTLRKAKTGQPQCFNSPAAGGPVIYGRGADAEMVPMPKSETCVA